MSEMITQAEFGRRMGFSRQAVHKAIQSGRLTVVDGKLPWPKARKQYLETMDVSAIPRSEGMHAAWLKMVE